MFNKFLWLCLLIAVTWITFFASPKEANAQCNWFCPGTHTWNLDLSIVKAYTIEPGCSGTAKVITFTLSYLNSGLDQVSGVLITDISSTSGGLVLVNWSGSTIDINLTGLSVGQSGSIVYKALLYGSGYFSNNVTIFDLEWNEPLSVMLNNNSQTTGYINVPFDCPLQWGLWWWITYEPVPLPSLVTVSSTVEMTHSSYAPKPRIIWTNVSIYYGFTNLIHDIIRNGELDEIKENIEWKKLPFVWVERWRMIWRGVLNYTPVKR